MYDTSSSGGIGGLLMFVIIFAAYFYFAFAQYKIAQKLQHSTPWFAFVPILNTIQLIQMAQKPLFWILFLLIPVVNIICFAVLWMDVAKYTGNSPVVGFFTIIPPISFITVGIMAFGSGKDRHSPEPPRDRTTPRQPQAVS